MYGFLREKMFMKRLSTSVLLAASDLFLLVIIGTPAIAQNPTQARITAPARDTAPHPPAIASISVCSSTGIGGAGSCPGGTFETHQIVLAPDGSGTSFNAYGSAGTSDEHSSVFSPGVLQGNADYLFFVASGTSVHSGIGMLVLSGGSGPDPAGQWTFDFPKADGYGSYPAGFGHLFFSPTNQGHCPNVADGNPAHQDQTFDLDYAAPGSVVKDPSSAPGSLLMVYEGSNSCIGNSGGPKSGSGDYISTGVATSLDYGHTWPTYRGTPSFNFVPLPDANPNQGPNAPTGVLGSSACIGSDCTTIPPATYGRYPVLSPPVPIATAMATGQPLPGTMADSELSAFVDDAGAGPAQFLYEVHNYVPGGLGDPPLPNNQNSDLVIARARLNGGTAPLSFMKWNGRSFAEPGIGGLETPIFPNSPYQSCGDKSQSRHMGSISYVEDTGQYLLTFVCNSPTDPASGHPGSNHSGSAWFYSTSYDLSDPRQWSQPQEIVGSWSEWDNSGGCPDWKGYYPTFMSLGGKPGHLSTSGYVFYLWGCPGGAGDASAPKRQFSSRAFTITRKPADVLTLELAKQKGSGKLIVYATSTDANAMLSLTANPLTGQAPIDLGAMSKTDPSGSEFFLTRKGLPPIGSVQITSTSGGTVTAPVKGH